MATEAAVFEPCALGDDYIWINEDGPMGQSGRRETKHDEKIIVKIPNLFKSILATPRKINPLLEKVKDTDIWIAEKLGLGKSFQIFADIEIPLLCSSMAPNASEGPLRAMIEWMSWVIFFHDSFDRGDLAGNTTEAAVDIIKTLAILDDDHPPINAEDDPLKHVYQCIWKRISAIK
ncbi:hypothetical protein TWF481_008383 [Arthrobotrys musiformis]|uniref:Uncharacterized protein n=1 Tax=Arthrobotrys musiformis TaxID=47236 RepID=A0AAV9W746_9PEZI